MMSADAVQWLFEATALMSAALILVLLLRTPLRRGFGARAAYALWLLVPLALLVTLLPAPERNLVPMRVAPVIVPADAGVPTRSPSAGVPWCTASGSVPSESSTRGMCLRRISRS